MIGISSLATDHLIVPDLMAALHGAGLEHVAVVVGGIVPEPGGARPLLDAGVREIFGPGSSREADRRGRRTTGGHEPAASQARPRRDSTA